MYILNDIIILAIVSILKQVKRGFKVFTFIRFNTVSIDNDKEIFFRQGYLSVFHLEQQENRK